jgi:hypothetical protein
MGRQSLTVRAVAELDRKIHALEAQIQALGVAKDTLLVLRATPELQSRKPRKPRKGKADDGQLPPGV